METMVYNIFTVSQKNIHLRSLKLFSFNRIPLKFGRQKLIFASIINRLMQVLFYKLSKALQTSAKMSSGARSAGMLEHLSAYASTTGLECLWKVSKRNLMVASLSSARPEVLPRFNNLSVIVASLTSKYRIREQGRISFSNSFP